MRGHKAILWEKENGLGGQLRRIGQMEFKKNHKALLAWYDNQLKKQGVEVKLNKKAEVEEILSEYPDAVVLAMGADMIKPNIEGIEKIPICFATDVLDGKVELKKRIIIVGGGLVGCELALKLADYPDREITVLEMLDELAGDLELFSKWTLTGYLAEKKIKSITGCTVKKVMEGKVVCMDKDGQQRELPFDNVILATGLQPREDLSGRLRKKIDTYVIGDNLEARKIIHAIHDGFNVAMRI
jgi:pyruvate/2-oxoglutarate dehydrogenase complex dihydrolipoamide dehydrogenase (E3) component